MADGVAAQLRLGGFPPAQRRRGRRQSGRDAEVVEQPVLVEAELLELAPRMAEARYLLAYLQGYQREHAAALEGFTQTAGKLADVELPTEHNRSVCLLGLAEEKLGRGDLTGANQHFDEVTRLGGHKSLYSDAYYDEASFGALYGGTAYAPVKRRYDPGGRFPTLYEKAVQAR